MRTKLFRELRSLPPAVYLLALLAAFGLGVGAYRLYAGLGLTTNLSKGYPWGLWISYDLSMVAFSGGAFTLAALVYVFQMHEFHPAIRPTVLAGLVGYGSVMAILLVDLGRWDRFYHFMIYANLNSALFEVSWCISLYLIILIYEFSPVLLENSRWRWVSRALKKLTIPFVIAGVTLSTLHQSSLGTLFVIMSPRLHPLWGSMLLPVFFLISSLASGLAMVISGATISYWIFKRSLKPKLVAALGWYLPWVLGFYLILKLGELQITGETELLFTSGRYSLLFWTELVIGVLLPMVLFSIKRVRSSRLGSLISALLVLGGVFLNRFNVSWWGMKPVAGFHYTPHWMEVAILVGVLSAIALVYTLVGHYFPLFEGTIKVRPHKTRKHLLSKKTI